MSNPVNQLLAVKQAASRTAVSINVMYAWVKTQRFSRQPTQTRAMVPRKRRLPGSSSNGDDSHASRTGQKLA
jgi:hypothetical protein